MRDLYAYGPGEDSHGRDAYSDYDPNPEFDAFDDEPDGGDVSRGLLKAGVALAGVLVLGAVAGYAYFWDAQNGSGGQGELPVVAVEDRPEKVRPEDPGGMEIPHQDTLVLNQRGDDDGEPRVERLLPPPETPEAFPDGAFSDTADAPPAGEERALSADAREDFLDDEPARVAELPELEMPETPPPPSGGDGETTDAGSEPEAAPEQDSASAEQAAEPESEPGPEPESAMTEENGAAEPEAEAEASDDLAALPPAGGDFAVQLAAVSEQERAREEWARLQQVYPDVLGGMKLNLQPTEVEGGSILWRIRTQPFGDRAAAESVCERLQAADQGCLVVAP